MVESSFDGGYVEITSNVKKYYRDYDVYMKNPDGFGYCLYKPAGIVMDDARIRQRRHPEHLYITVRDRIIEISGFQKEYNRQLRNVLRDNPIKAKEVLVRALEMCLSEPRNKILDNMNESVNIVVEGYLSSPNVVKNMIKVSTKDYSTSIHCTNVMLFCLGYARHISLGVEEIKLFGLMGLMHDVGKIRVPDEILKAPRKLSDQEYEEIKQHSKNGKTILRKCQLDDRVMAAAHEHHERIDGSGYPEGKTGTEMLPESKAIAIADVFEALTNWRPYKGPIQPLEALSMIMEDVNQGKLDKETFRSFAHGIVGMI
jgi:putative nucleotidyltransferase with HDIG domain